MSYAFIVLFIAVLGFIIFSMISRYVKNENSPVISTRAQLIDKKRDWHTHTDANGATMTDETLYLIYQLDTGSEMRFTVNGRIYRHAVAHEWGQLTFQGTRFLRFEGPSGVVEK